MMSNPSGSNCYDTIDAYPLDLRPPTEQLLGRKNSDIAQASLEQLLREVVLKGDVALAHVTRRAARSFPGLRDVETEHLMAGGYSSVGHLGYVIRRVPTSYGTDPRNDARFQNLVIWDLTNVLEGLAGTAVKPSLQFSEVAYIEEREEQ